MRVCLLALDYASWQHCSWDPIRKASAAALRAYLYEDDLLGPAQLAVELVVVLLPHRVGQGLLVEDVPGVDEVVHQLPAPEDGREGQLRLEVGVEVVADEHALGLVVVVEEHLAEARSPEMLIFGSA